MAAGTTVIDGLLASDDTHVMLAALSRARPRGRARTATTTYVTGFGAAPPCASADLFLGNAGTAMRPLAAALAVVAATRGGALRLRGVPRMHERPIGDLVDALRALGCAHRLPGRDGLPPLRIGAARGTARPGAPIRVRGDVSSQFLTALLLALPLRATTPDASRSRAS